MDRIDEKYWTGERWNGHRAFNTVAHNHISCYSPAAKHESCDLTVVECSDGSCYVEDGWGGDAQGAENVWNPKDRLSGRPHFFPTKTEAIKHAVKTVASVSGVDESAVSIEGSLL